MPLRTIIIKATRSGTASTVIIRRGASGTGTGGTGDHGDLTGLGDDDHTQYLNNARGDARYSKLTGAVFTGSVAFNSGNLTMLDETDVTSIQLKSALGSVSSFSVYTGSLYATQDITIPDPNDTGYVTYPPVIRMEAETGSITATNFIGSGSGLTGTAAGLTAGTASSISNAAVLAALPSTTPLPILSGGTGAANLDALQPKITSANAGTTRTALGSKAIGDALFQSETIASARSALGVITARCTSQTNATSGSSVIITGMGGIQLAANTVYKVEFLGFLTSPSNGYGLRIEFTQDLNPTVSTSNGFHSALSGNIVAASQATSPARITLGFQSGLQATITPCTTICFFRTGAIAPVADFTILQIGTPSGNASIYPGSTAIITPI